MTSSYGMNITTLSPIQDIFIFITATHYLVLVHKWSIPIPIFSMVLFFSHLYDFSAKLLYLLYDSFSFHSTWIPPPPVLFLVLYCPQLYCTVLCCAVLFCSHLLSAYIFEIHQALNLFIPSVTSSVLLLYEKRTLWLPRLEAGSW